MGQRIVEGRELGQERALEQEADETSRRLPLHSNGIGNHLDELFAGMEVIEHHLFRVTRNADFEVVEDRDEDLLQALERELAQRKFGPPVRLEVAADVSDHVLDLLARELDMDAHDESR